MSATTILRRLSAVPLILLLLAVAACATGGMGGAEGSTAIEVRNNLIPPTSLTIYAVPGVGSRRLIGVVEPGATKVLRFDPSSVGGQYQFVAETTGGRDILSNPISFSSGASLRWDVSSNIVTVTGG